MEEAHGVVLQVTCWMIFVSSDSDNGDGLQYLSPSLATVIPFPLTMITFSAYSYTIPGYTSSDSAGNAITVLPSVSSVEASTVVVPGSTVASTVTFTVGGPVVTSINFLLNDGNQNVPQGPGAAQCDVCILTHSSWSFWIHEAPSYSTYYILIRCIRTATWQGWSLQLAVEPMEECQIRWRSARL